MIPIRVFSVCVVLFLVGAGSGLAQPVPEADDSATVEAILSRYVEALGGKETLEVQTSRCLTGTQITDFSSREHPSYESFSFEMRATAPTSYLFESWSSQGGFQEGYDGQTGWARDKCGVRSEERNSYSKLALALGPQSALHIGSYFPGLTYSGTSTREGAEVHALVPSSLPPEHYTLYFSADNGLLVGIGYYWVIGDYREVDDVMIPHRIAASRKGGSTVYEVKTVEHNVTIPDSQFAMPSK